jgi:hypothetical protein
MIALVLAACLSAQDEPGDLFDWARKLDDLDLSVTWGDFSAELSGELDLELLSGKEAPGLRSRTRPFGRTTKADAQEDGPGGVSG